MEIQNELGSRGVSELPMPTYGYMSNDEFYHAMINEDLINNWAIGALKGLIYTDRDGRNAGAESYICQIPWVHAENPCAC